MAKHSLLYGQTSYLFLLIVAANSAAEHARWGVCNKCEGAKVSKHVVSHNKDLTQTIVLG